MSDAQNVPVFIRDMYEVSGRFFGRLPVSDLEPLMDLMRKHSAYNGKDSTTEIGAQFVAYEDNDRQSYVGFEIVIDVPE